MEMITPDNANNFLLPENQEGIVVDMTPYYYKIKKAEKDRLEKHLGKPVPEVLMQFYNTISGFTCLLDVKNKSISLQQGVTMTLSYNQFLFGYDEGRRKKGQRHIGILWRNWEKGLPIIDRLESDYFVFDNIDIKTGVFGIINLQTGQEPGIALYRYPHRIYPLKLTFPEYIENALKYRGFFLWQKRFINFEDVSEEDRQYLENERSPLFYPCFDTVLPQIEELGFNDQSNAGVVAIIHSRNWKNRFSAQLHALKSKVKGKGTFKLNNRDKPDTQEPGAVGLNPLHVLYTEQELGKKIPDEIIAFYSQVNGLFLKWEYKSGNIAASSDFKIPTFYSVFELENRYLYEDYRNHIFRDYLAGDTDAATLEFAKNCRIIFTSEFTDVVINVEAENFPLYMLVSGKFYPLRVNFEGFFEALLQCMGLEYFPRHLTNYLELANEIPAPDESFFTVLEHLFPDAEQLTFYKN